MALWNWPEGGTEWSFVIDTDSYAGNFERELGSYVVGRCDEEGGHRSDPYAKRYRKELPDDPFEELVETRIDDPGDDGIDRSYVALAPTPGYSNNGNGKHTKLKPGQKGKYPAYQSVAIFLSREPTVVEQEILATRAAAFESLPATLDGDTRPKFRVTGCRLVEEKTTITSRDVALPPAKESTTGRPVRKTPKA